MYSFDSSKDFYGNLEYFLHIVVNNAFLSDVELANLMIYLSKYTEEITLADDLYKYFNKRLSA